MRPRLYLRDALLLGVVQGPTELLPVSSSAHIALIPRLLGWSSAEHDPELHNSLEVALHAGAAAALLIAGRAELARPNDRGSTSESGGRQLATAALALAPPAIVGYLLEQRPARRPSTPRGIAAGLALGGVAMALADARPQTRVLADTGLCDGLVLGLAQAVALLPGVSRSGATLTVTRMRGFAREDAGVLSWRAGLPVILGAAALKGRRLVGRGAPALAAPALTVGAGAAFVSTLASALLSRGRRGRRLLPFALYRLALALLAWSAG